MFRSVNQLKATKKTAEQAIDKGYVLIAEDNTADSRLLRRYLEDMGKTVKCIDSGSAALKMVKSSKPILVISNVLMPEINGYELCQILKSSPETASIPFILVSSSDSTPDKMLGFQQGCDDYIIKPFEPGELKVRVDSLLKRSKKGGRKIPFKAEISSPPFKPTEDKSMEYSAQPPKTDIGPPMKEAIAEPPAPMAAEAEIAQEKRQYPPTEHRMQAVEEQLDRSAPPVSPHNMQEPTPHIPEPKTDRRFQKTIAHTPPSLESTFEGGFEERIPEQTAPEREARPAQIREPRCEGEADKRVQDPPAYYRQEHPQVETEVKPAPSTVPRLREYGEDLAQERRKDVPVVQDKEIQRKPPKIVIPDNLYQSPVSEEVAVKPPPIVKEPKNARETDYQQPLAPQPVVEEEWQPSLDKISAEKRIKASVSVTLKLPSRRDIVSATPAKIYQMGKDIFHSLQEADGVFGPDDYLSISGYCEKLTELSVSTNELMRLALDKNGIPDLATHSVNVAVLSIRIGNNLKLQSGELSLLAIAALLLDIGMIRVHPDILTKKGELTHSEISEMRNHVHYGKEMVEAAIGTDYPQDTKYIVPAIYQSHEREGGTGYLKKLTGDKICKPAKIIGLADTYEALCHTRYHRIRQSTYSALQEAVGMKKTLFDPIILRALVNELTFFPIGCYVRLNTDEIGIVIDTSPVHSMRPKIRILINSDGTECEETKTVDLVQSPFLYVVKALDDDDVPDL